MLIPEGHAKLALSLTGCHTRHERAGLNGMVVGELNPWGKSRIAKRSLREDPLQASSLKPD